MVQKIYNLSKKILNTKEDLLIGGDFNVIENIKDAVNFEQWENDALGHIDVRTKFRELCSLGLTNLSRIFYKPGEVFSFWDYQKACWERNDGILIDHFLISPKNSKCNKAQSMIPVTEGLRSPRITFHFG